MRVSDGASSRDGPVRLTRRWNPITNQRCRSLSRRGSHHPPLIELPSQHTFYPKPTFHQQVGEIKTSFFFFSTKHVVQNCSTSVRVSGCRKYRHLKCHGWSNGFPRPLWSVPLATGVRSSRARGDASCNTAAKGRPRCVQPVLLSLTNKIKSRKLNMKSREHFRRKSPICSFNFEVFYTRWTLV